MVAFEKGQVKMFHAKFHKKGSETVLAFCDKEIIGKRFEGDGFELEVSEGFYGDKQVDPDEIEIMSQDASSMNIMGDIAVEFAIEKGLVSDSDVLTVCGIKHVQIFSI